MRLMASILTHLPEPRTVSNRADLRRALVRNAFAVFAVAVVVRLLAAALLQPHFGTDVTDLYDVMGRNLLAGHGFSYQAVRAVPSVTRAPFYPLYWAAALEVFGRNFILLRMAEGIVDATTAALVVALSAALYELPRRYVGSPALDSASNESQSRVVAIATCAGAVYAVQPFSIYYALKLSSETWFTLWLVLALLCIVRWYRAPGYGRAVIVGAVLGVLMLNKSTGAGLVFLLVIAGLILSRKWGRVAYLSSLVAVAIAALVIMPWLVRDYRVAGDRFVPIQTLTWWNFWSDFDFSPSRQTNTVATHYGPGGGHPYGLSAEADVQQEARLRTQAFRWIWAHPGGFAKKIGLNRPGFPGDSSP